MTSKSRGHLQGIKFNPLTLFFFFLVFVGFGWGRGLVIYSHTFAFVRTIFFLQKLLRLPAEKDKTSYDTAAFTAFLATLVIAWGKVGALLWCGVLILSLGSEVMEVGDRWHVCGTTARGLRDKRDLNNLERFPKKQPCTLEVNTQWTLFRIYSGSSLCRPKAPL